MSLPRIFDRKLSTLRRARIRPDDLLGIHAQLADRVFMVNRTFNSILELHGGLLDDDEVLRVPANTYDLIVGAPYLHTINDLPGVLLQIRNALKPDGVFIGALFGGDTLFELRQSLAAAEIDIDGGISPRVFPFGDVRALGGLLQRAGFAIPLAERERLLVRYPNIVHLMHDLRRMGETNILVERSNKPLTRRFLERTAAHYAESFSDPDKRLRATFDVIFLTGWAPHESQQQPLKPGSARTKLADALGTKEIGAGEKP